MVQLSNIIYLSNLSDYATHNKTSESGKNVSDMVPFKVRRRRVLSGI
jgi:hypothetical protein